MTAPDFSTRPAAPRLASSDLALLATGVLAAALCAHAAVSGRAEVGAVRARLAEVRRDVDEARRRTLFLEKRMGDGVTGQAWLTAEAPPSRVLAELGEVLPPDVRLDGLSLTYGRRLEVEMRVVARSPRAYDLLLERLQASPRLKDLVLGAESREGEVQTTVHASFEPGP
jgi:Tfp pilus assembly protein PilN